jgi:adenylate cyclase
MNTLSHYVARPVLEEIVRRDLQHSLEPSLKNVTVLVADMEGYTRLTSAMSLKMAATLTKTFLDRLTRPVLEHGGTLDKYSGDGLVAFWGAPLPCEDQADTAISAALEIIQEIQKLNERKTDFDASTISVRIGIESGLALVGDLGTDFRSTYTAVGDCINFASRLESAAKNMGTPLLLGPAVSREIKNHELIQLNSINLRNTNTTLEVFTLRSLIK